MNREEAFRALADGKSVECQGHEGDWVELNPCPGSEWRFRLKPEKVRFRLYKYRSEAGGVFISALNDHPSATSPEVIEASNYFIEWIDHDWREA